MAWVRMSQMRAGCRIKTADQLAFTCIDPATELVVGESRDGFHVRCRVGLHYLDGEVSFGSDEIVGFHLVEGAADASA